MDVIHHSEDINVYFDKIKKIYKKEFFQNGKRHRDKKPAIIEYDTEGFYHYYSYFQDGKKVKNNNIPNEVSFWEKEKIEVITYEFLEDLFYPNYLEFDQYGNLSFLSFKTDHYNNIFNEALSFYKIKDLNQFNNSFILELKNSILEDFIQLKYDLTFYKPLKNTFEYIVK